MDIARLPPPAGSYTNLFDTREDVPLGGSAHSLRTNVHGKPVTLSNRPSPLLAGKKRSADVRAPMAEMDECSPTSPAAVAGTAAPIHYINSPTGDRSMSLASDEKYPTTQALITDTLGPSPPPAAAAAPIAGRRVQVPVRTAYAPIGSRPTDAAYVGGRGKYKESGYSSSSTTATSRTSESLPAASAADNKQALSDIPGAIRRPMSFVKALEMSDALQMQERERTRHKQRQVSPALQPEIITEEEQRAMYGSSYEISV